jgi:arylsulfatase
MFLLAPACGPGSVTNGDAPSAFDPDGTGGSAPADDTADSAPLDTGVRLEEQAVQLPSIEGHSILIFQVDTLRADHLSAFGYHRDTLPSLMARDWLVVRGERTAGVWTVPSTASFLSGRDQYHHNVRYLEANGDPNSTLDGTVFPEEMSHLGYETALMSGNLMASTGTGMGRGFMEEQLLAKAEMGVADSPVLAETAIAWLEALPADVPFLLHMQPTDPHSPLLPAEEDQGAFASDVPFEVSGVDESEQLSEVKGLLAEEDAAGKAELLATLGSVYDETLLGLDRSLESVLVALEDMGRLDSTLVVFTADHGESLGDEGVLGHGDDMREEVVQIPLMFLHPDLAGGTIRCPSRNYDVWPTLWAALGQEALDGVDGTDLAEGCAEFAPISAWALGGDLIGTGMADEGAKIADVCGNDGVVGTTLTEPTDTTESTDTADLPDGGELQAELRDYQEVLDGAIEGGLNCP